MAAFVKHGKDGSLKETKIQKLIAPQTRENETTGKMRYGTKKNKHSASQLYFSFSRERDIFVFLTINHYKIVLFK